MGLVGRIATPAVKGVIERHSRFELFETLTLSPVLDISYWRNQGAAFSFLAAAGGWQRWLFTGFALLVSAVIALWLRRLDGHAQKRLACALMLVMGGAIGNVIDRVRFGYVVDFIVVHWNAHYFPAFNVADSCITVGAALMLLDAFLDGGACAVGIESTIIDCTRGRPVLLRPGMLDADTLASTAGQAVLSTQRAETELSQASPKASGTLASHYAPSARLRLLTVEAMDQAAQPMSLPQRARVGVWSFQPPVTSGLAWHPMPNDPVLCAQALFQTLRALDASGVEEIWVTPPPPGVAWDGVRDRLTRASQ